MKRKFLLTHQSMKTKVNNMIYLIEFVDGTRMVTEDIDDKIVQSKLSSQSHVIKELKDDDFYDNLFYYSVRKELP